jgi:hypothetical protein
MPLHRYAIEQDCGQGSNQYRFIINFTTIVHDAVAAKIATNALTNCEC